MLKSGIYKILNKVTGKFYIGSSHNIKSRNQSHYYALNKGNHKNKYLQNAWNKYGQDAFKFEIIEFCEKDKLEEREQHWLDWLNCCNPNIGYNIAPTANSLSGYKQTEAHILKRTSARKKYVMSEETKEKIRNTLKGRPISEEAKLKMSASRKGKQYRLGTKSSDETKLKLSIAGKDRKHSAETIEKCRIAKLGHAVSLETRIKISETLKQRNASI